MLVAGRHRVEAMRVIGKDPIAVRIADFDDIEAQLWRISENLHRNELSALERAEQIAEFARLSQEKADAAKAEHGAQASGERISAQVEQKIPRGRPEGGDSFAARDLGITRQEVQRSKAIATLPDEVKAKAADLGLDRNQSALLAAAKAQTPQAQISTLERRAERSPVPIAPRPSSLRNLENIAAGELARWVKETTPRDRLHAIDVMERAAAILKAELQAEQAA
jgi:ParB family chromosome partitioning protein